MATPSDKYAVDRKNVIITDCSPELLALIRKHTDKIKVAVVSNLAEIERLLADHNIRTKEDAIDFEEICKLAGVEYHSRCSAGLSKHVGRHESKLARVYPEGLRASYYLPL